MCLFYPAKKVIIARRYANRGVAQVVERLTGGQEVASSSLVTPIFCYDRFIAEILDFTGFEAVFVLPSHHAFYGFAPA